MDFRIGHGYDVHALADGLPLVLGGVEIAHTKGCVAHSDGDVAIHALCDALLGAAGAGRHRAALSRHVGRFCGHRLEDPAAPRGGTVARKGLRDRERGLHDPRPAAQGCGRTSTPCAVRWPAQWA